MKKLGLILMVVCALTGKASANCWLEKDKVFPGNYLVCWNQIDTFTHIEANGDIVKKYKSNVYCAVLEELIKEADEKGKVTTCFYEGKK